MKKITIIVFTSFLLLSSSVHAAGLVPQGHANACGSDPAIECGNYSITDIAGMGATIAKFILGLVGSLSLLMLIYGGVLMILSEGSNEKLSKGKKAIEAAIVGLIIVFASYLIIKYILAALGMSWNGDVYKMTLLAPFLPIL